jgi:hypothetical protein
VPVGVAGHRTQRPRGQVGPPGPRPAQPRSSLDPGGERRPISPPLAPLIAQLVGYPASNHAGFKGLAGELLLQLYHHCKLIDTRRNASPWPRAPGVIHPPS